MTSYEYGTGIGATAVSYDAGYRSINKYKYRTGSSEIGSLYTDINLELDLYLYMHLAPLLMEVDLLRPAFLRLYLHLNLDRVFY